MFQELSQGDVFFTPAANRVASGPRTAVLADGTLACTFMVQTKIGSNDFVPMISFSPNGEAWSPAVPVWPDCAPDKSLFGSIRRLGDGRFAIAGQGFPIDCPGESFWSDEVGGMKENFLFFSISQDGRSFPPPTIVDLPFYASAEQAGGLLGDADGTLTMVYSCYPTIEGRKPAKTNWLVMMRSTDGGKTFVPSTFGETEPQAKYAENWINRLEDGTLIVTSWLLDGKEAPDVYFLSRDDGAHFAGPFPMSFRGQTTSLTPYEDGLVLIPYNQRQHGELGVWLATARPHESGFREASNQLIWQAQIATQNATSGDFSQWTDYSFGEPQVTVLPDKTLLLVLWYAQGNGSGVRFVRLTRKD